MRALGIECENPQDLTPAQGESCEVWPEHAQVLGVFMDCLAQFELVVGMGGVQWLAARAVNVEQIMRWHGVPRQRQPALWALYRVMQDEAVNFLNERRGR
jgi:hypothetical protein